jgi:capsular exopolysaccharide synthesis family protein
VQKLDLLEIDYRVISRKVEAKTPIRDAMLKRIIDIETLKDIDDESPLRAGAPTGTPITPIAPNHNDIVKNTAVVFLFAFLFIPIGIEFLDNRVKSPWDIEVFIGRDMLAGIPRISLVSETNRPLIVAQDLDENLVESFRGLYSRIQMNSDGIFPKSILVTSAIPSEGKSLLAANLAHSFANHGKKTLLIDFDLRRPGLHKFCDVSNDRGLLTYIQELQANPSANINFEFIPEVYPNLCLLPSGGKTRTATELLDKVAFTNLFIKLKREFDVLLIDSSPVGLFPDSNALATKVDELIFVTRYAKVGRRTAKSMLQKLEETGTKILGVVLNDLPEKKSSSYYYNYGYYGYGYGYYRYKYYSKYYGEGVDEKKS